MTGRIVVTGAAGAGTTTLGRALAERLGWRSVETDDYYFVPSTPPYRERRGKAERLALITADLEGDGGAVVSGSVAGWGRSLEDAFELVVYLWVPADLRVARLTRRETERRGSADWSFLTWAAQFDEGRLPGRSAAQLEGWLAERTCPVLRLHGDFSTAAALEMTLINLGDLQKPGNT